MRYQRKKRTRVVAAATIVGAALPTVIRPCENAESSARARQNSDGTPTLVTQNPAFQGIFARRFTCFVAAEESTI